MLAKIYIVCQCWHVGDYFMLAWRRAGVKKRNYTYKSNQSFSSFSRKALKQNYIVGEKSFNTNYIVKKL